MDGTSSISEDQRRAFQDRGVLVLDLGIESSVIDGVVDYHQHIWSDAPGRRPPVFDPNRTQDAWQDCVAIHQLATHPRVLGALRSLYGREPRPFQTLNFPKGTQQPTHSDSIHFNCEPFGLMCGVWVALEDVGPDQGPLEYYPASHKLPFIDFSHIGVKAHPKNYHQYEKHIESFIGRKKMTRELGVVSRGQVIIWSANLLHGGSRQADINRSRHSQVTHYYFQGAKPWRPMFSDERRRYFVPNWIPYDFRSGRWGRLNLMIHRGLARISWLKR